MAEFKHLDDTDVAINPSHVVKAYPNPDDPNTTILVLVSVR